MSAGSPRPKIVKWILLSLAGVALVLLTLFFVVPLFFPWTRLNCWHDQIDITCGRYRYQRYLLGVKVAERVEETELSGMYRDLVGEPPEPEWRLVSTRCPWYPYGPHYRYHSALWAVQTLCETFDRAKFSDEAKKAVIVDFLRLLQEDGRDGRAREHVRNVFSFALSSEERAATTIDPDELPSPPQRE